MSTEASTQFIAQFANQALQQANGVANRIGAPGWPTANVRFSHNVRSPNIQKPPEIGDLVGEDLSGPMLARLNGMAEAWANKYFPNLSGCLRSQPEEWACGILSGRKPFGVDKAVFDAVWHGGRDRAYRSASTEQEQIRAGYSMRGFSMPPGAMIAAERNAEIRASEAISEVNLAEMLRESEIMVDLQKFAATTAVQLKTGLLGVLANYYNGLARIQGQNYEGAKVRAQAYSAMVSGLSAFYNVELGFEELRLKAAEISQISASEIHAKQIQAEAQAWVGRSQGLGQASKGFAEAAGAAANAIGALQAEIYSGQVAT